MKMGIYKRKTDFLLAFLIQDKSLVNVVEYINILSANFEIIEIFWK